MSMINKPDHYCKGRKYEPKDVIRDWNLGFNLGNAVKYISRAGRKDDIVQELKKAQEYLQFEIEAIEAEREKAPKHECIQERIYKLVSEDGTEVEICVPVGTPVCGIIRDALYDYFDGGKQ